MLNVKVGDKVKSCLRGWGTVRMAEENCFLVDFGHWHDGWFTSDGKCRSFDKNPEIVEVVEVEKKKWEPEGGKYYLSGSGEEVTVLYSEEVKNRYIDEGRTYRTRTELLRAHKMIRPFQRLVAWVLENVPNYDPDNEENDHIVLKSISGLWTAEETNMPGIEVRMPKWAAKELAEKLNSGEVEL